MLKKTSQKLAQQLVEMKKLNMVNKLRTAHVTFRTEFKKQTVLAITAAFGFLIALVWRDYLMSLIKAEQLMLWSVLAITALCVIGLIIISKWASSEQAPE